MSTEADCPPSLNSDQIAAVNRATAALQVPDREAFLQAVHDRLLGQTALGDGSLFRALREAQAEFLRAKPLLRDGMSGRAPKYGRARHFIGKAR